MRRLIVGIMAMAMCFSTSCPIYASSINVDAQTDEVQDSLGVSDDEEITETDSYMETGADMEQETSVAEEYIEFETVGTNESTDNTEQVDASVEELTEGINQITFISGNNTVSYNITVESNTYCQITYDFEEYDYALSSITSNNGVDLSDHEAEDALIFYDEAGTYTIDFSFNGNVNQTTVIPVSVEIYRKRNQELSLGTYTIPKDEEDIIKYSFTPTETGYYEFQSLTKDGTELTLMSCDFNTAGLEDSDDESDCSEYVISLRRDYNATKTWDELEEKYYWESPNVTKNYKYDQVYYLTANKHYYLCEDNYYGSTVDHSFKISKAFVKLGTVKSVPTGIYVSWSPIDTEYTTKYRIFRKTAGSSWKKVADTYNTSYTDKTVANNTTYTYTVRALNSSGYVSNYDKSGKTVSYLAGTTATVKNATSGIVVSWKKVTGAKGYYVYRKSGNGKYSKIKTITKNTVVSYTDTAVKSKNGTIYTYAVKAYYSKGASAYKEIEIMRLTTPTLSYASNLSYHSIKVGCTANKKADCYEVQWSTSSKFSASTTMSGCTGDADRTSMLVYGLVKGKRYYIRIRAVYEPDASHCFYSAWSNVKNAKVTY